jgi:hypothetical protein
LAVWLWLLAQLLLDLLIDSLWSSHASQHNYGESAGF